jgi:hypothetical protein
MDTDDKASNRTAHRNASAVKALRRLDEIGAIKLDVLLSKSADIRDISAGGGGGTGPGAVADYEWENICYPFYIRIGPRHDFDLVTVVDELRGLGFEVNMKRQM